MIDSEIEASSGSSLLKITHSNAKSYRTHFTTDMEIRLAGHQGI